MNIRYYLLFVVLTGSHLVTAQPGQDHYQLHDDLEIRKIAEDLYIHTTWKEIAEVVRFPSNGLVIVSGDEAFLVDSAWGDTMNVLLLNWIQETMKLRLVGAVFTHAHDDRMMGIQMMKDAGATTYAFPETAKAAMMQNWPPPDSLLAPVQSIQIGARTVETFHPGPAHTLDNIVVWIPGEHLLFGGCMVRPANSNGPGNVADADVFAWPKSIRSLQKRYEQAKIVVPSHGPEGDPSMLDHTIAIMESYLKEHQVR